MIADVRANMKTKRVIAGIAVLFSLGLIGYTLHIKFKVDSEFELALNEKLLTIDGQATDVSHEFQIRYKFAHGYEVVNANTIDDDQGEVADLTVQHGDIIDSLKYSEGARIKLYFIL